MRIESIIYIKELLEAETIAKKKAWKKAGEILDEKEQEAGVQWNTPDSKVDDNIRLYRSIKENKRKAFTEAQDALEDFMRKEWN